MRLHELESALNAIGPFYRMVLDADSTYSWGPVLDEGPVAVCSFQEGIQDGQDLEVRVSTYPSGHTIPAAGRRTNRWAKVYIDGKFARDAELVQTGEEWVAVVIDAQNRAVRIQGHGVSPTELRLALTIGDHFPTT